MSTFYVYLILSQNRLVILQSLMQSDDYHMLFSSKGNPMLGENNCKIYCMGYMVGTHAAKTPINSAEEFE